MQAGELFADRFAIEALIGEGGVGQVYRALDQKVGVHVALKCLRPQYAQENRIRRRFMREARAVAALNHGNIVRMHHYGEDKHDVPYIAMELIDGTALSERRQADLSLSVILYICDQVLGALAYIHARGIIHRDVKPENLVIVDGDDPDRPLAKLLDFGFARVEDDSDPKLTAVNQDGFGTPQYMAPEQASGNGKIGPWTDLYAMGVVLYEFLAGEPPFTGAHGMAVALKHLMEPVPPLVPRPGIRVPPGLEAIVMRALKKETHERFPSAAEMRRALAPFHAGGAARAGGPGPTSDAAARIAMMVGSANTAAGSVETVPPAAPETGPMPAFDGDVGLHPLAEGPVVGREDEQLWLWGEVHRVFEHQDGRIVLVGARPGMGKSRLVGWLRDQIVEGGWMQCVGGVHAPGEARAGSGLRGAIEQLFGALPVERGELQSSLRDVLVRWGAGDDGMSGFDAVGLDALASFLRPVSKVGSEVGADGDVRGDVLYGRIVGALRLAAAQRPVLMTLEGIERAGPELAGFLHHLAGTLQRDPFPLLVVATFHIDADGRALGEAREVERTISRFGDEMVVRRDLGPIPQVAMLALLEALGPFEPRVADGLARRTDGNPFFARELTLLLRQTRELVERGGRLTLARSARPKRWPRTLEETLLRRAHGSLRALPDGEFVRRVLECAVVLGEVFDYPLLVDYLVRLFEDRRRVERAVESLLSVRLLQEDRNPDVDRLQFLHGLLRDALVNEVASRSTIKALHLTAAQAMVAHYGEGAGHVAPQIAGHFQNGGRLDDAARFYMVAAGAARQNGQMMRALELLELGDRLLSKLNSADAARRRATLWLDLSELELLRGGENRAQTLVARVHQWAQQRGEATLVGRALLVIGDLCRRQNRLAEAGQAYGRAAETFRIVDDDRGIGKAALGRAMVERARGRPELAIDLYEQARKAMARLGDDLGVARAWQGLGELALRRADYDTARMVLDRACTAYQRAGARPGATFCHWLLGEANRRLHDLDAALTHFAAAARGYAALGDSAGLARAHQSQARIHAGEGRFSDAGRHFRSAIAAWHALGDGERVAATREELGMVALEQREFALAGTCLEDALVHAIDLGDQAREVTLRACLAWIRAEQGDVRACDQELKAALELDRVSPVIDDDLARAFEGIAEVDARDGDTERAALLVERAIRIHESLGAATEADRLRHRRATLGAAPR